MSDDLISRKALLEEIDLNFIIPILKINMREEHKAVLKIREIIMNMPTEVEAAKMAIAALEEVQQYREIGTVEECLKAVEKQTPKKPHRNYKKFSGLWCKCGWYLGQKQCLDIKYCPNCGQAIAENLEGMEDV